MESEIVGWFSAIWLMIYDSVHDLVLFHFTNCAPKHIVESRIAVHAFRT
jgi:hypothetical protein